MYSSGLRRALQTAVPEGLIFDAVEVLSEQGQERLVAYASMGADATRPEGLCEPAFEM